MTTNDDNVWALDATNGKVKWRWQPDNGGVYKNFGIVANRGVALCDNHVFVLTLDMTIAQLNPATGYDCSPILMPGSSFLKSTV